MRRTMLVLLSTISILVASCSDDKEAACKCGSGFVCDPQTNACVPDQRDGGAPVDDNGGLVPDGQTADLPGSSDGLPQTTYFDTVCPPQVTPITVNKSLTGRTTAQPAEGHCGINDPFTAVGQVTITEEKKVRLLASAAADVEIVLSLRTACAIDHGCFLGLATADYNRILEPGTYNIFVATNKVADFTLQVEFLPPIPDTGND